MCNAWMKGDDLYTSVDDDGIVGNHIAVIVGFAYCSKVPTYLVLQSTLSTV